MTFQNTKITKSTNFEIIVEDQKVYFSDYPDFPLFEKAIFPDAAWEQMEVDFYNLCATITQGTKHLALFVVRIFGTISYLNATNI